jgi:O-acetyl-ADP-ribose deacetylase (regulator of RNase III)
MGQLNAFMKSIMNYQEIEGDLIKLAKTGRFDVIAHGCNCFCRMKRGIAPQIAEAFGCDKFPLEAEKYTGDINKLGQIDYDTYPSLGLTIVNAYTQYQWGTELKPFDYDAFTLCMRKMNHVFAGKKIGLPQIGSHLAGGDWELIRPIIQKELKDCNVTVVIYKPE